MKSLVDRLIDESDGEELEQLVNKAENKLYDIPEDPDKFELEMLTEYEDEAKDLLDNWGQMVGLSSGLSNIDDLTYGMLPGELIVIAGKAGLGKSMLCANLSVAFAREGHMTVYITLELMHKQLVSRFMKIADDWADLPIVTQKEQWITDKHIRKVIENAKEGGASVIIVDYLQLLSIGDDNQHRKVGQIVQTLKRMAVELEMLVIVIAALNRQSTNESELELHHLRDSSHIEYFADQVLFLNRAEDADYMTIKIAKNRSRPLNWDDNTRLLSFDGARFYNQESGAVDK